ncbi:MAG: DUF2249 domain-containing protein [Vulcanimicrobiaceae bacterium]
MDVRTIPKRERHAKIFEAFDALEESNALLVLSDHEPRPLHAQFEAAYAGGFVWSQRCVGDGRWEVRLRKYAAPAQENAVLALLRRCAVFADASTDALGRLARGARSVSVKRDRSIVEQGVLWPYVGVVRHGVVSAVLTTPSGREQALFDVFAAELFGEFIAVDGGATAARYVAQTAQTQVLLLPVDDVRDVADRDPAVARELSILCVQRSRAILERYGASLSQPVMARVAKTLLAFASPQGGLCEALEPLPSMTQPELALAAGTVKEVVSRALADLESSGALAREGGHIVRLDRAKLEAVVHTPPYGSGSAKSYGSP